MKLKFINPELNLESVAIVGSSGSLCEKHYSDIINEHHDVIRFNRAPVTGYEHIVGSKTTLRAANVHVFRNQPVASKQFEHQEPNFIKNLRNEKILYLGHSRLTMTEIKNNTNESCDVFIFDYKKLPAVKNECKYMQNTSPTVGCIAIMLCLVSGITPSLFGFDVVLQDNTRTHYWENRSPAGPCHNVDYEKKFIKELVKNKKVKFYD
ncbi:MAG TPA: glycosyltransferase family 29 protein [Flavobacteriaceae bacterium]|nr:glycosyltransferase family 29 protein [Flavobacteriaceae bacterium]